MATPAASGAEAVLEVVASVLAELGEGGDVGAVGAGTPGGVDLEGRVVGEAANIAGWNGVDLRSAISRTIGRPAYVRNDGNLAAYAEWAVRGGGGEGSASRALLFVGLGTGIGGGYIEDGAILGGVDDKALEIGHVIVHPEGRACACGRSGCAEAYASGPSIGRIAVEMAAGFDTPLARAALSGSRINAREVYEALAEGDELASVVHAIAAEALSRVIGQALAFLAPDTVVLGGGVMTGAKRLLADVAEAAPRYVYAAASAGVRFEDARLGREAGLLGAALYGASTLLDREELLGLAGRAAESLRRRAGPAIPGTGPSAWADK
jgi:glucokinase